MPHVVTLPDGGEISDERARLDMALVHEALAGAYWMGGRPRALTERSWAHCLPFGVYGARGETLGFARVLTDFALRAHLADLMVVEGARGRGLGKALVAAVLGHPELATVTHWTLSTRDAQGLYARHGFRPAEADGRWMVLVRG